MAGPATGPAGGGKRRVEVDLALLRQLHDGRRRHHLGFRPDAELGVGVDLAAVRGVLPPIALGVDDLAVLGDGDGGTGRLGSVHLGRDAGIDVGERVVLVRRRGYGGVDPAVHRLRVQRGRVGAEAAARRAAAWALGPGRGNGGRVEGTGGAKVAGEGMAWAASGPLSARARMARISRQVGRRVRAGMGHSC